MVANEWTGFRKPGKFINDINKKFVRDFFVVTVIDSGFKYIKLLGGFMDYFFLNLLFK